jgi:hypothetical protein
MNRNSKGLPIAPSRGRVRKNSLGRKIISLQTPAKLSTSRNGSNSIFQPFQIKCAADFCLIKFIFEVIVKLPAYRRGASLLQLAILESITTFTLDNKPKEELSPWHLKRSA